MNNKKNIREDSLILGLYNIRLTSLKKGEVPDFITDFTYYDTVYDFYNSYECYSDILTIKEYHRVLDIKTNRSRKRSRCFKNLKKIFKYAISNNYTIVFGTLTFSNEFLEKNYEAQKKALQRYLKKHYAFVLKNADFGKLTSRLHYHFIGITKEEIEEIIGKKSKSGRKMYELKQKDYKLGFEPTLEVLEYDFSDKRKLSNYIVKLNNHSNKISVRKTRLSLLKNDKLLDKWSNSEIRGAHISISEE